MLSDTVSRTIFWLWLALGLVPSVFVIVGSFAGLSIFAKQDSRHRAELERGEILVTHHAGITVGPKNYGFSQDFGRESPQRWELFSLYSL